MCPPNEIPVLALAFKNKEAATRIFSQWISQVGRVDESGRIRLAIVQGIDRARPASYSAVVGSDHAGLLSEGKLLNLISRIHRMDPPNSTSLAGFLEDWKRAGTYILAPAHLRNPDVAPTLALSLGIRKEDLVVRQAWEIGENDPDICAISADVDPILPDGVEDPPVLKALGVGPKHVVDGPP